MVLTLEMVGAAMAQITDFPADLAREVKHLLGAQMLKREWGSPVAPRTPEAATLAGLLEMTSRVDKLQRDLEAQLCGA